MISDGYIGLIQKKAFLDAFKSLSNEQREMFFALTQKDKHFVEIKEQLNAIQRQAEKNKYSFGTDLLANVTGNVITDSAIYVLSKLFKGIRL